MSISNAVLNKHLATYKGPAMVIGAAEGLGRAYSEALAHAGKNLILVDKQERVLQEAAVEIRKNTGVAIETVTVDLAFPDSTTIIVDLMRTRSCALIVYNAAYAPVKPFTNHTAEELDLYINVNCRGLLQVAHAFCQRMAGKRGGFLAMSSLAGLRGTKYVAPYGASKAFAWNLMEGLYAEFHEQNLDFLAICASAIDTPGYRKSLPADTMFTPTPSSPDMVARESLMALGKTARCIPGRANRLTQLVMTTLLPRRAATRMVNSVMEKMFGARMSGISQEDK